ncbi:MAG: alpha/beta fold hydrolase [Tepidamorphaceae bacterium]
MPGRERERSAGRSASESAREETHKMRKDIEFKTEDGVTLRGWHYVPDNASGPAPTIVMAHGFSAVKEMYLDRFAEAFAAAGLAAIVFDNRNFGASDGEPRYEIDPWQQVRDYRDAITWAETLPETDAGRIGIWGSSYSGGHVMVVGALDRRVKCVVAQVPLASGHRNARRLIRADNIGAVQAMFDDDRRARMNGEKPAMIPVVAEDPAAPSALPTPDSWTWFTQTGKTRAPSWHNEVTLRSVEMFTEYEPISYAKYVSPTPMMIVVALGDVLTVSDLALEAYEQALGPKRLVTLSGGHFDAYVNDFEASSGPATEWFVEHLGA